MIIPAPHSRFLYFPHRWQQNFQTFGAVNNTTLNSLVKIKKIWFYQRVPDIRHGIIDLIFCRKTPQIRVPRNRYHFSTERNRKKEQVEHILLRKSCYIKPLSLVKIPPPLTWIFFSNKLNWISSTLALPSPLGPAAAAQVTQSGSLGLANFMG